MRQVTGNTLLTLAGLLLLLTVAANIGEPSKLSTQLPQLAVIVALIWLLSRSGLNLKRGRKVSIGSISLLTLGLVAVTLSGLFAWVDYRLQDIDTSDAPASPLKVWSTRGLVVEGPEIVRDGAQNTIGSIRRAFDQGAKGVEVDVFFDPPMGHFIVSHDFPYHLKNGDLLPLSKLLEDVGHRGMFWLDWKKLRHLQPADFQRAMDELNTLTAVGNLKERFYVEGEDPVRIGAVASAGFLTIYDTHPLKDGNFFTPLINALYKTIFYVGDHSVMGIESGPVDNRIYGPRSATILKNVPLFVYHVPDDASTMQTLARQDNVRVILPRDQSRNLFDYRADR